MLKTVLITGASRGIGKAIADQWVEQSHRLIVTAQSEKGVAQLEERYAQMDHVTVLRLDLAHHEGINDWVDHYARLAAQCVDQQCGDHTR